MVVPPRSNVSSNFSFYFARFQSQLNGNMSKFVYEAFECKCILISLTLTGLFTFECSAPDKNGANKPEFTHFQTLRTFLVKFQIR